MSYSFTPLSDEELDMANLLPEGEYDFQVSKSARRTSKQGNAMAELQIKTWDRFGKICMIFDYLVFSTVNMNIRKISHFCKSVGLHAKYKEGNLPEELDGYSGKCLVGIQDQQSNPNGGFYPKKNVVLDYIEQNPSIENKKVEEFSDEIPF